MRGFTCFDVVSRECIIRRRKEVSRRAQHTKHKLVVPPRIRHNSSGGAGTDDITISEANVLLIRIGGMAQIHA